MYASTHHCRVSDGYAFKGLQAIVLENAALRVTVLADKGTDIIEFLYKPYDVDFMWKTPYHKTSLEQFTPTCAAGGGSFLDVYEGGWQEILPNYGIPATYKGAEFGVHGELPLVPWKYAIEEERSDRVAVRFWTRLVRSPFRIEKTLRLEGDRPCLFISETVTNEGAEPMEFMWGHHPAIGKPFLSGSCRIDVPAKKIEFFTPSFAPTSRVAEGSTHTWPKVKTMDGKELDYRIVSPESAKVMEMSYLLDLDDGWYGLTDTENKLGFAMRWDKNVFRSVWLWAVYGGGFGYPWYGQAYNIALEPASSWPSGLENAVARGTQLTLQPGESLATNLLAAVHTGKTEVQSVEDDGTVR